MMNRTKFIKLSFGFTLFSLLLIYVALWLRNIELSKEHKTLHNELAAVENLKQKYINIEVESGIEINSINLLFQEEKKYNLLLNEEMKLNKKVEAINDSIKKYKDNISTLKNNLDRIKY